MRIVLEVVVGDELNDVRGHILAESVRIQGLVIAIKLRHLAEISIADTDDDHSHWQFGAAHQLINRRRHIIDDAVCDDDQDRELLSLAVLDLELRFVASLLKDLAEVGWAIETGSFDSVLVAMCHAFDSVNAGIEDVSVEGEAVRGASGVRWDCTTEPIQVDLLI